MKHLPRRLLKLALILNFPATLVLIVLISNQIHIQLQLTRELSTIKNSLLDLEIISSNQASPGANTLSQSVNDLRSDINQLKALQRSQNLTDQLTGKVAGASTAATNMYPNGIQGYVALDTNNHQTADVIQDRTQPNSAITTITDDTPMPFSFKANGWYLVNLKDNQGWIKSTFVEDVTAKVVTQNEPN